MSDPICRKYITAKHFLRLIGLCFAWCLFTRLIKMTLISVKSKFEADFRRFSLDKKTITKFDDLYQVAEKAHGLYNIKFIIQYIDPKDNAILPINNDKNCKLALDVASDLLRLLIQLKGKSYGELKGYKTPSSVFMRKKAAELVRSIGTEKIKQGQQSITLCDDFHKVSSIIDDGTVPECMRRVRLIRTDAKPLGFYIRDGYSIKATATGVQHVPGIFISRLIAGGLADSTGLLAVKDEVIEVNGIEVYGKTLDQVTDMMIANSSNLIITVKPFNQKTCIRRPKFMTAVGGNNNGDLQSQNQGSTASSTLESSKRNTLLHPASATATESGAIVAEVPGTIDI